ncbi:MAG: hypothetical protein WCR27_04465 [Eubacteriales bacterium]
MKKEITIFLILLMLILAIGTEGCYPYGLITPLNKTGKSADTLSNKTVSTSSESLSCQGPLVSLDLPKTTHEPQIKVAGYTHPDCAIYINGIKLVVNNTDYSFTTNIPLKEGKNILALKVIKTGKTSSSIYSTGKIIEYIPQEVIPFLQVDLKDKYTYNHIIFEGKTDPGSSVLVNNFPVTCQENGSFLTDIHLFQGDHIVNIVAKSDSGLTSTIQKKVNITYPLKLPTLIVSLPSQTTYSSSGEVLISGFTDCYNIVEIYCNSFNSDINNLSMVYKAEIENTTQFSCSTKLSSGKNDLIIRAIDPLGNVKEEKRTIIVK